MLTAIWIRILSLEYLLRQSLFNEVDTDNPYECPAIPGYRRRVSQHGQSLRAIYGEVFPIEEHSSLCLSASTQPMGKKMPDREYRFPMDQTSLGSI
jgi:hypothetical protein